VYARARRGAGAADGDLRGTPGHFELTGRADAGIRGDAGERDPALWRQVQAMFRDAVRVGQIVAAAGADLQHRISIEEPLSYFDQAAVIRLSDAKLTQLVDGPTDSPLASLAAEARTALVDRDAQRIRAIARSLREAASGDEYLAIEASAALLLAGAVIEAAPAQAANAPTEKGS